MKISKELLSEVLEVEILAFSQISKNELEILSFEEPFIFDIYELVYKCRLKALEWGYEIVELSYTIKVYKNSFEIYSLETETDKPYDLERFFNLCQWILDNKD